MRIVVLTCLTHFICWCHLAWLERDRCSPAVRCVVCMSLSCLLECGGFIRAELSLHWILIYYCKSLSFPKVASRSVPFQWHHSRRHVFLPFTLPALSSGAFKHRPPLIPTTWFHLDLWHCALSEFPLPLIYLCIFCCVSNRTPHVSIFLFQAQSHWKPLIASCI